MFAGIAGMSAEEAWYSIALHLERARLLGQPATGASVDIHKCFDQLVRELVFRVLAFFKCCDSLFCFSYCNFPVVCAILQAVTQPRLTKHGMHRLFIGLIFVVNKSGPERLDQKKPSVASFCFWY